jgi:hypothetical protein
VAIPDLAEFVVAGERGERVLTHGVEHAEANLRPAHVVGKRVCVNGSRRSS